MPPSIVPILILHLLSFLGTLAVRTSLLFKELFIACVCRDCLFGSSCLCAGLVGHWCDLLCNVSSWFKWVCAISSQYGIGKLFVAFLVLSFAYEHCHHLYVLLHSLLFNFSMRKAIAICCALQWENGVLELGSPLHESPHIYCIQKKFDGIHGIHYF